MIDDSHMSTVIFPPVFVMQSEECKSIQVEFMMIYL